MTKEEASLILATIKTNKDDELEAIEIAMKTFDAIEKLQKEIKFLNRDVLDEKVATGFDLAVSLIKKHLGGWYAIPIETRSVDIHTLDVLHKEEG